MRIKLLIMLLISASLFAQNSHRLELQNLSRLENPFNSSLSPHERQLSRNHQFKGRGFGRQFDPNIPHFLSDSQLLDSIWVNSRKQVYIYDTNNNLTEELHSGWDSGDSIWVNLQKWTYSYDDNNNLTERLTSWWISGSSVWVNMKKWTISYDGNNNMVEELHFGWDYNNSDWWNAGKSTYTYDANNYMIEKLYSLWNYDNSAWDISDKWTYSYDTNNILIEELYSWWRSSESVWVDYEKWTYIYDTNNILIEELFSQWVYNNSDWRFIDKNTYTYDANNNMIEKLHSQWDADNSVWVPGDRYISVYNEEGQLIMATVPFVMGGIITIQYSYDEEGRLVEEIYGNFEPVGVHAVNTNPQSFTLEQNYPNPFNPTTTISYNLPEQTDVNLTVFDIQGQEVVILQNDAKSPGNYEVQWNGIDQAGNQVSTGVYFYQIRAGEYVQTRKMLLIK